MSVAAGVGAFLMGFALFSGTRATFILAAVIAIAAGITTLVLLRRNARELCSASCVSPSAAVTYVDWYGTVHSFEVRSRQYAALFMLANAKKLLNLTDDHRQLMQWGLAQAVTVNIEIETDDDDEPPSVTARVRPAPQSTASSDDEQLVRALAKLESLKGASSRRAALDVAL